VYKEPWVNPARRRQVAGIGVLGVLVAIGGGIGIGLAIGDGDHRDRPHPSVVMFPGRIGFGGPGDFGPRGEIGGYPGYQPGPGEVSPSSPETPTPAPSSTG
jgi:hypothetical protein